MREIVYSIRLFLYYDNDFVFPEFMSFKCGNSIRMKVHKYQDNRRSSTDRYMRTTVIFHINVLVTFVILYISTHIDVINYIFFI